MPWAPELFSVPALARYEERHRHPAESVPYYEGLMMGELDALVGSFTGSPELHDPLRGRIRGKSAFERFATESRVWLEGHSATVEPISHVIDTERAFEEVVLKLDGPGKRVDVPVAIVADLGAGGRMEEVRVYFSNWALSGRHANRPPLLQTDPALRHSGRRRRVPASSRGGRPRRHPGRLRDRWLCPRAGGGPACAPRP